MDTSEVQIKRIVLNRMHRCSVCHHDYDTNDISVVSRKSDMWMMLVECTDCHARNYVAAVLKDGDPDEARLALRRLHEEATGTTETIAIAEIAEASVQPGETVDAHDVLDMHEFLKHFDGDFRKHFAKG